MQKTTRGASYQSYHKYDHPIVAEDGDPPFFSTSGEQLSLYNGRNGVGAQFDTPIGDYASQANLQRWYRPGFDLANIGKDYGVGTPMPLLLSGAFMHAGRIGGDAPTG